MSVSVVPKWVAMSNSTYGWTDALRRTQVLASRLSVGSHLIDLCGWPFFKLDYAFWYHFPRCFGADEDVHSYLNLRISVDTSQSDSVNIALVHAAECRATLATELQAKAMMTFVGRQQVFAGQPLERVRCDLCVCRCLGAEGFATSRTMTGPSISELSIDSIGHFAAETSAGYGHRGFSQAGKQLVSLIHH